jgi:sugar/nucleoside kinase (ribokinase family)
MCNGNTCLIYGINTTAISDGIVATVILQISPNPSTLTIPIQITRVVAATAAGDSISAAGVSAIAFAFARARKLELACATAAHSRFGVTDRQRRPQSNFHFRFF